ncbi:maleylpyruvate isomerase N-terminal domain-containing protein [Nocardia lijiangensis]|uniref:maleylpyruvate isomerase N-terminal domain-containing protein n=1 Tax=Nocardia lijiangensis TaxID=299618 RepID=UPI000A9FB851|nr:maleylpyruvate isomerase N-terminal domain-containing protein [Nocardia lijiangensis]
MDQVSEALREMAGRFAELASKASTPEREVTGTPGWSIVDVLGHVSCVPSRYRELALGRGANPHVADARPSRTGPETGDELIATVTEFGDEPRTMMFDGGQRIRAGRARGTLLGEFVVHGYDIARTLGQPWPITAAHVPMIMDGLTQVIPGWVNAMRSGGHTATYEYRLRGFKRYVFRFDSGTLTVDPAETGPIDVCLSIEPVTALLLNYGRIGPVRPALSGQVLAWGRKPWLAPGFSRRFLPA